MRFDDANGVWSELTTTLPAGTYYVGVTTRGTFANNGYEIYSGNYLLEILDGVNDPMPDLELPEVPTKNDTLATAQPLQQANTSREEAAEQEQQLTYHRKTGPLVTPVRASGPGPRRHGRTR